MKKSERVGEARPVLILGYENIFSEKVINEQSYIALPVKEVTSLSSLTLRLWCNDSYVELNVPHYFEPVQRKLCRT